MTKVWTIVFFVLLFANVDLQAKVILSDQTSENINLESEMILDEGNSLTVDDLISLEDKWQKIAASNLTFGLERSTVWIRTVMVNSESRPRLVHLEFNPVFLEDIRIFSAERNLLDNTGSVVATKHGEAFPTLSFWVEPGEQQYYLSVTSRSNSLSMFVRSDAAQAAKNQFDLVIFSFLLGSLISLLAYHLFLFVSHREIIYLHYSGFLFGAVLFTVSFTSFHKGLLPSEILGFKADFWWSALAVPATFLPMFFYTNKLLGILPRKDQRNSFKARAVYAFLMVLPVSQVLALCSIFLTGSALCLILVRIGALLHVTVLPAIAIKRWARDRSKKIELIYALSWLPLIVSTVLVVAWLSGGVSHHNIYSWSTAIGIAVQSLALAFVLGQKYNALTKDKFREQSLKLKYLSELKENLKELETRNKVINTFASEDILDELDRGENPLSFTPRTVNRNVVFIDMQNYTKFSESHSTSEIHSVINEYFVAISEVTYRCKGVVDKMLGDAMMLVFDDVKSCTEALIGIRKEISRLTKLRLKEGKEPLRFGLGVSYGEMLEANFGSQKKLSRTLVGDSVNVASRLEALTRILQVDILCTKSFVDRHENKEHFRPAGYVLLKGKSKKTLVFEYFGHNRADVISWKRSTVKSIEKAIELELNENYEGAIAILEGLIEKCPPHHFIEDSVMDRTLYANLDAISEKMKSKGLAVNIKHHNKSAEIKYKEAV